MNRRDLIRRVASLDKMIIAHPAFDAAVRGIEECSLQSEYFREPVGSLLLAEGGMGKTTVCRTILSRMPKSTIRENNVDKAIVPAFYFSMPASVSITTVAESMLHALGADNPSARQSIEAVTKRLCDLLEKTRTVLVFADEFHNLFLIQNRTAKRNEDVRAWIRRMVDWTGISFCLVGLPTFSPLLASEGQHGRRFPMEYRLGVLTPGDQELPGTLAPFLSEAMHQATHRLEMDAVPKLDSLYAVTQVYAATGGIPSYILSLIKRAALDAFSIGTTRLTLENFATAWDSGITARASLVRENPFRLSHGALATAMKRQA